MIDVAELYYDFWSKAVPFGAGFLDAYPENTVSPDTPLPYITYTVGIGDFLEEELHTARIWTRSSNIRQLMEFIEHIDKAVPQSGVLLKLPDGKGSLMFSRGTPWTQRQPVNEMDLQVGYINVVVRSYRY